MHGEWPKASSHETFSATRSWTAVADLAASQHGIVSLAQLVQAGVSPSTVRGWVGRGLLVPQHQGVFAIGHGSLRPEGHYLAAVLACGEGAVLSHRSAAALLDLRNSSSTFIEVTAPRRTGRSRSGLRVHSGVRLRVDEVTRESDVPCTSVSRTILDLASVLPPRGVAAVVEAAERQEVFDLRTVSILLARHVGRRGTARLRAVLAAFNAEVLRAKSEPEARLFHLCVDSGLPAPLVNRFVDVGDDRFEVDLHWPSSRVVVEVDSVFHDTVAARERDRDRDAKLRRHGWSVIRTRREQIVGAPEPLIADLWRRVAGTSGD